MLCKKHFRFTNCALLIPALAFLVSPVLWFFLSHSALETTEVRYEAIIVLEIFGILELFCYFGGRYYTSKLYKADFKQMLLEDIDDSDDEDEDEDPFGTTQGDDNSDDEEFAMNDGVASVGQHRS